MALEDLQSQYGPYNPRGTKGTGEGKDPLAYEPSPSGLDTVSYTHLTLPTICSV